MKWYEQLGLEMNPFEDNPAFFADAAVGMESDIADLVYRVQAGSMVFVEGLKGSGKTLLLHAIIRRFGGKKRVIYLDANSLMHEPSIEVVMQRRYGMFGRLFNIVPKNMILLVDNVQVLSKRNAQQLQYFFDHNYISSVVFTGERYAASKLPKSIRDRIGTRVVRLHRLTPEQAESLVRLRLGAVLPLPAKAVSKIYKASPSVREFMMNCERVCAYAVENGRASVSEKEVSEALGSNG